MLHIARTIGLSIGAIVILALGISGCQGSSYESGSESSSESKLTIVATTGMVADAARAIAGDHADVTALMGPGIDPHLFNPSRSDVQAIMDADLVLYNGLLLEGKMSDTLIRAATSGRHVYAVTERVDPGVLIEPEEYEGHADPHLWMDPRVWVYVADAVRDALIAVAPSHADSFTSNAAAYADQIRALDTYSEQRLETINEQSRVLVTAHDAFNYFGARYGFEVVGIQGLSTESEAGVRDIERMVSVLVERKISAVFVESTVSERNINALIAGAGAQGHEVVIGGELYSDAMGPSGTYEGTYIGMIDHNITTITRALGGQAPELGMNGSLGQAADQKNESEETQDATGSP